MTDIGHLPEGANDVTFLAPTGDAGDYTKGGRLRATVYEAEMERLQ